MNKKILLTSIFALMLTSCGGTTPSSSSVATSEASSIDDYSIKWVTPTGAPTLAFYDQAKNENWLSTSTPASVIPQAFAGNTYDAIVFDGTSGLNLIKKNAGASHYALARWINELPFYLVSTKHTAEETITLDHTIDAFVQTGTASQALRKLAKDDWNIGELTNVTYEDGVNVVQSHLVADDTSFDYYVLAEPVYTLTKAALNKKGITLNLIKDLQSEWSTYHNGSKIPSAGLFINTDTLASHPKAMTSFVTDFDTRVDNLVNNPVTVKETLLALEEEKEGSVASQFGVGLPIVNQLDTLQASNKLGFLDEKQTAEGNKTYANLFASAIGGNEYAESSFASI